MLNLCFFPLTFTFKLNNNNLSVFLFDNFLDINECQQNACGGSSCINTMGSFQCQCQRGYNYQGYGYGCQGIISSILRSTM